MHTCRVCGSSKVRTFATSRRTGSVIAGCRTCGVHWLHFHPDLALHDSSLEDDLDLDVGHELDVAEESCTAWVDRLRSETVSSSHEKILTQLREYLPEDSDALFDVGAGGGGFLAYAQSQGFKPDGNEILIGAVEVTRREHDIAIRHGVLSQLEDVPPQDAVTLWCVLAHVTEPEELMSESLALLRHGGVMFLQTPRWSFMDTVGLCLHRISGGRWSRLTDRRVAPHHMVLHSTTSIRRLLEGVGFVEVAAHPRVRFSLQIHDYLESLGVSPRLARILAGPFEALIDRNLFPRNVLDVFAFRPAEASVVSITPMINRRRRRIAAAAASVAIVASGTSVAAAQNALPAPVQTLVASATELVLPDRFAAPRPELAEDQPATGPNGGQTSGPASGSSDTGSGTPDETSAPDDQPGRSKPTSDAPEQDRDDQPEPTQPTVPKPNSPGVKVPDVKIPDVKVPDVEVPDVDVPDVEVPDLSSNKRIQVPKVDAPKVEVPEVKAPEVKAPEVDVTEVKAPPLKVPAIG